MEGEKKKNRGRSNSVVPDGFRDDVLNGEQMTWMVIYNARFPHDFQYVSRSHWRET